MVALTLFGLEKAMRASKPVFLRSFSQSSSFLQSATVEAKPQANMPTAKTVFGDTRLKGSDSTPLDWKCCGIGAQPVVDPPKWLAPLFDAQCYTTEFTGNEGVWYAVMFGLDPHFITRTASDQERCVLEMKQQMAIELDQYYQQQRYRQYGYSKSDMYCLLNRADAYHSSLGHYLSDFLDLNLMVLLKDKRFYWVGQPRDTRVSIALYNADISWGSIVHPDHRSHLFADTSFVTRSYMHLSDYDIGRMVLTMDDVQIKNIRRELRKMKMKELQDKAIELEIDLYDADHKKKLKKALMEELCLELTGQPMVASAASSVPAPPPLADEAEATDDQDVDVDAYFPASAATAPNIVVA